MESNHIKKNYLKRRLKARHLCKYIVSNTFYKKSAFRYGCSLRETACRREAIGYNEREARPMRTCRYYRGIEWIEQ